MSLKDIISRLPVSLGCGTWQAYDYAHADPKVFEKVLFTALDLGIQCFDSAESYGNGEAEKLLGRVIKGNRQQLLITSKFAHHHSRPDLIEKSLMKSLKRLGTDYLDVYFQHWPPQGGPRSETLETLIRLRKAGAVRFIGVSNWTPTDFEQCESLASQLDCVQVAYNYLWRHELESIQETITTNHLAVFTYSPLAQGLLAKEELPKEFEDARDKLVLSEQQHHEFVNKVRSYFQALARKNQVTLASVALAWVRAQSLVDLPLVGASQGEHLLQLISSLSKQITFDNEPVNSHDFTAYKSMWNWRP